MLPLIERNDDVLIKTCVHGTETLFWTEQSISTWFSWGAQQSYTKTNNPLADYGFVYIIRYSLNVWAILTVYCFFLDLKYWTY